MKHPGQRFVWLIGAIHEEMPDLPDPERREHPNGENNLVLWDRQEKQPVCTMHNPYAQALCLEITTTAAQMPFTSLESWFNGLDDQALASEGLPTWKAPFRRGKDGAQ